MYPEFVNVNIRRTIQILRSEDQVDDEQNNRRMYPDDDKFHTDKKMMVRMD